MRLNANQIINRVRQVMKVTRDLTDALTEDDKKAVLKQAFENLCPSLKDTDTPLSDPGAMADLVLKAIKGGLESEDAQMVRAAMEWMEEHEGREFLRELTVEIVPYTVADKSLKKIVIEAGDDVVKEIKEGLQVRAARQKMEAQTWQSPR